MPIAITELMIPMRHNEAVKPWFYVGFEKNSGSGGI